MKRSHESRLARLERAETEAAQQNAPLAVVADEQGNVSKVLRLGGAFDLAPRGLTTDALPFGIKVYLFDPDAV